MGRSKFPGKPSKHVNRTRINVLPTQTTTTVGDSNNVVTVETGNNLKKPDDALKESESLLLNNNNVNENAEKKKEEGPGKCNSNKRRKILSASTRKRKIRVQRKQNVKQTTRRSLKSFTNIQKMGTKAKHSALKEGNNLVGKFVLPSRSIHSSRVIKPNKRFINVDSDTRTFKNRVINNRAILNVEDCSNSGESEKKEETNNNNNVERTTCNNPKLVLRQARLKLHNQSQSGPEGPFSSGSSNTGNPPGTVTCGVCGAVRFYRFVKQARKFNIYSCESCRKFISKMIKRQSNKSLNTTLVCHKGQGMCHVPPIVRSQQWKLIRCAYRARCPACWLKMCLRSFQMPANLKHSLTELLPKNMQINDNLFTSSFPLLSWQSTVDSNNTDQQKEETPIEANPIENEKVPIRPRSVRLKTIKSELKATVNPPAQDIRRQKLDLKGPRVKHVCRSASIVLGHPLATFGEKKLETDVKTAKPSDTKPETDEDGNETLENKENKTQAAVETKSLIQPPIKPLQPKLENCTVVNKRDKINKTATSLYAEPKPIKKGNESNTAISVDFWEAYDPDEIYCSGFSLIGSEPFPMQAICFLCGSAGKDPLLHCSLCCEPYHPYCLEQFPTTFNSVTRLSWLCPRCTTCHACGQSSKQKVDCQKCHKSYHPECFNVKWNLDTKPTVCSNCLKCKSCNADNITKFIGNLALCVNCFKLRNKGHFCPLCQKCYDDNDINTKMMECSSCNKWIHAKCEGMLEDHYQMLSLLPDSVKFLCRVCATESTPHWRKAVQSELRSHFNNVLRLFSKHQAVRTVLKSNPIKALNTNNLMLSARKIQFTDNSESDDADLTQITQSETDIHCELPNVEATEAGGSSNDENDTIQSKSPVSPVMIHIKNKVNSNECISLREFDRGMQDALKDISQELLEVYHSIIKKVFPWYDTSKAEDIDDAENDANENSQTDMHSKDNNYDFLQLPAYEYKKNLPVDTRTCSFCKGTGDGLPQVESRLLYCGQNEWVHANCALWSSEVYEEIDGSLQNVQGAISRGRSIRCASCKHKGASVGCCFKGCYETYHFKCAQLAKCQFLHDKKLYCLTHDITDKTVLITNPNDFDIRRPVYIELDRKRKKYAEPNKINFMTGSLCVTNLGKIVPILSDNFDAIIPTGFTCSRLFWSTEEPWKLVPYVIRTSVKNAHTSNTFVDRNFTIDHSLPKSTLEKRLKEVTNWHKELENERECFEAEEEEEPQNPADILPQEVTDALFDELQHDLLDGLSVQDVLNSYEELLNMDFKTSEINCNENVNLNVGIDQKKEDFPNEADKSRELKRSKSEILSHINNVDKSTKAKNSQRSCSLTWSCKLDNTLAPVTKKRKIVPRENNMFFQLLQVDGACDSSGSECGSPTHESECLWTPKEEPVSCEKCHCTYRTIDSYKRHLQTCEAMFTSESDSEEQAAATLHKRSADASVTVTVSETEPRVITAYESFSTYQATQNEVHSTVLNTQTFLTTESTSEVVSVQDQPNVYYQQFPQVVEQKLTGQPAITLNQPVNLNQNISMNQPNPTNQEAATISLNHPATSSFCVNQTPLNVNQFSLNQSSVMSVENNQPPAIALHQPITINQGTISVNAPMNQAVEIQPHQVTLQSVPFSHEISPILNITPQNQITIDAKMLTAAPNLVNSVVTQAVVPQNQWVKPIMKPVIAQKAIRSRAKPRLAAKKTTLNNDTMMISQGGTTNSSMILQHLPSANVVPRFLETFQHHNGQNVQYVATLAPQINTSIQPQTQLLQLQSDNNFLSIMPGVQPTTMIIQPRLVQDQLLVDSNGSVLWTTQPVQPVYYGFETIVQNTVLQSSQFLPTTVPGVLTTNSSYSATTQVFQTSKLEPVLDVSQGSFVLLNSGQLINQPISQSIAQNLQNQITTAPVPLQNQKQNVWKCVESNTVSDNVQNIHQNIPVAPTIPPIPVTKATVTPIASNTHSITLPVAPFIQEPGIPTNIVTPTPKQQTTVQSRPMSRVLPMQTNFRDNKKVVEVKVSPPLTEKEVLITDSKNNILLKKDKIITESFLIEKDPIETPLINKIEENGVTRNDQSIKLVLHKQNNDGLYKITNNFISKSSSVPIAPLKPMKPKIDNLKEIAEIKIEAIPLPPSAIAQIEKDQCKVLNVAIPTVQTDLKHLSKTEGSTSALLYTVETQDGFRFSSTSLNELWGKIFETVQSARLTHNMAPLPASALNAINNIQLLGLKSNGLKYLIEQLPGANKCMKYKPLFHMAPSTEDTEDDLSNHTFGCAKFIPLGRKKDPNDMFGWLSSKHRKIENSLIDSDLLPRRGSVTNLPMAMRFRQLKETSKTSVGVYRSGIHRRGLFALKDIEAGDMVIEYAGEVIRSILTDKREKHYNSKGIGCYMFRVDDNLVVDATMKGNAARFINHSCDPNCFSKVVEIHGHKHIIIFALRKILCGEELTYDYKFPFEEDKIPCTCGAKRCRKFLN